MKYLIIIAGLVGAYAIAHYAYNSTKQIDIDKTKIVHLRPGEKDYQFTLDQLSAHYKGSEKVDFFADMAKDLLIDERNVYMQVLVDSFKNESAENISQFAMKMKKVKLTQAEMVFFAKGTCVDKNKTTEVEKLKESYKSINIDYAIICL